MSGIQQGLASDLRPTSRANTVGVAVGVSVGVIAVAAVLVVVVVVIAVIFYRQKRYKHSIPTYDDDETRYIGYDITRPTRSASEMVEKKSGTFVNDTTIANVPEVVSEEEEGDTGEKSKLCSEDVTTL